VALVPMRVYEDCGHIRQYPNDENNGHCNLMLTPCVACLEQNAGWMAMRPIGSSAGDMQHLKWHSEPA
jgi:hypothetical protein